MKFILGKKIEMTQIWQGDKVIAVTKVAAGPCPVVQVRTKGKDGYTAVQIGYGEKHEKNIGKAQKGHYAKAKNANGKINANLRYLREFRMDKYREADADVKIGDLVSVNTFAAGDIIDVIGTSKGKGFQGVMKRHHFAGHKITHGNKDQQRMSGSVGAKGPAHVFKGTKMGGRMGGERTTEKNLEIIGIDGASNILTIKGQIPGARNGLVMICGRGELKLDAAPVAAAEEAVAPAIAEEAKEENIETVVVEAEEKREAEAGEAEIEKTKSE